MTEEVLNLSKLPEGWAWSTLGEVGTVKAGGTPSTSNPENFVGAISWITPADLTGYKNKFIGKGQRNISEKGLNASSAVLLPTGTVLFSSRAPIGYVVIAENPVSTNQGFKNLICHNGVLNEYVFYYLKASKKLAESFGSGTTFKEVSASRFAKIPIPLCPTLEQLRIVGKVEALFSYLDAGVESLRKVQAQLKRYRQSVLKYAFEGKLTKKWRDVHKNQIDLAKKDVEGYPSDNTVPEWARVPLQTLSSLITKGESPLWQGFDYVQHGVTFIRSENVLWGKVSLLNVIEIPEKFHEKLKRSQVKGGDVLVNLVGASIGRCSIVPLSIGKANINQAVAIVRLNGSLLPSYLMYLILSPRMQETIRNSKVETARPNISLQDLRQLIIPLPSLPEQEKIVEEIESRFSIAEKTVESIKNNLEQANCLRQTILKYAFEGKLVLQDPNDESAEKLLERIKAERFSNGKSKIGNQLELPRYVK